MVLPTGYSFRIQKSPASASGTIHHANLHVWMGHDGPGLQLCVGCLGQAVCVLIMLLCRYEVTQKDVTKWQSIVKANREAPTLKFASGNEDVPRTSTTSALTAKFAPAQDYEKEIAAMLEAAGAHNEQAVQESEEALALKASCLPRCWADEQT